MSLKRTAQKMSQAYQEMDLGPRVGFWLRSIYAGSRAKNIARDYDVSEATAKRWLAGVRPTSDVLQTMARRWGWRFVSFVFEPAVGTPAMYAEMDRLQERMARLEAERLGEDARTDLAAARTPPVLRAESSGVVPEDTPSPDSVSGGSDELQQRRRSG